MDPGWPPCACIIVFLFLCRAGYGEEGKEHLGWAVKGLVRDDKRNACGIFFIYCTVLWFFFRTFVRVPGLPGFMEACSDIRR